MLEALLATDKDYTLLFIRVIAGLIIFPYGMQKLFGWFNDFGGGVGISETLARMSEKKIPGTLAWLIIIGQSIGSLALMIGLFGRVAAAANFVIFTGALIVHLPEGWTLNWTGKKKGEGIEYFIMLLALLLIIAFRGSGPLSVDIWLVDKLKTSTIPYSFSII